MQLRDISVAQPVASKSPHVERYLNWLFVVLVGYVVMGRGFAYIGVAPLYIGEVTALLGVVTVAVAGAFTNVARLPAFPFIVGLWVWGALCTFPYLPEYRVDSLRDAVLWGYSVYAVIVGALLLQEPLQLRRLLLLYRRFAVVVVIGAWLFFLFIWMNKGRIPRPIDPSVPLVVMKGGDLLVHVAGASAFILLGLARARWILMPLIAINVLAIGIINRGGMVAFVTALLWIPILRPYKTKLPQLIVGGLVALLLLAVINPSITIKKRTISVDQLWENVVTIVGTGLGKDGKADSTTNWRLLWWEEIIDYTVNGEYFWTGKGYGVNLATSDGFQVGNHSLRSPHNGHMTILGRSGVPGFLLWIALHGAWLYYMLRGFFQAKRTNDRIWTGVFTFLIIYWTASLANASFDVYLEGPMGGIWLWTIFGVGLAAARIYEHRPEVLWDRPRPAADLPRERPPSPVASRA